MFQFIYNTVFQRGEETSESESEQKMASNFGTDKCKVVFMQNNWNFSSELVDILWMIFFVNVSSNILSWSNRKSRKWSENISETSQGIFIKSFYKWNFETYIFSYCFECFTSRKPRSCREWGITSFSSKQEAKDM